MKLKREFYQRPTVEVARDLVGKFLVHQIDPSTPLETGGRQLSAEIIETEAYSGFDDLASHASRGKTARNVIMFGSAGFAYVYLIYGLYHCLNLVTEREGFPAAVLIRGLDYPDADGPGKLCRAFNITREYNGVDVTRDKLYVENRGIRREIIASKRVGVDYAGECKNWLWRFRRKDS